MRSLPSSVSIWSSVFRLIFKLFLNYTIKYFKEQTNTSKLNESSLLEETTYQIDPDGGGGGADGNDDDEGADEEPVEPGTGGENLDSARELNASLSRQSRSQSKKRKKDRRSSSSSKKRKRSKRRRVTHEELGPRPEPKIDLQKLENDVIQLKEQAASTGQF